MIINIHTVSNLSGPYLGLCSIDKDGDAQIYILKSSPKSVRNYVLSHELQHARDGFDMPKWKSELRAHWYAILQHPFGCLRGFPIWIKKRLSGDSETSL